MFFFVLGLSSLFCGSFLVSLFLYIFFVGLFLFLFFVGLPSKMISRPFKNISSKLPFSGFNKKLSRQQITLAALSYIFIMLAKHYWPNVSSLIKCKNGRKIHIFILGAGDATFLAKNVLFD